MNSISKSALDARARRDAARVGLIARKSRWRRDSIDNQGDFMLVDVYGNYCVGGARFDMSAEDVIAYCGQQEPVEPAPRWYA